MPITPAEAAELTVAWLEFASGIKDAASDFDGAKKADGEQRRFSRSELRALAKQGAQLVARTLIDALD